MLDGYLKCYRLVKDGKEHRYRRIVESHRLANGETGNRMVFLFPNISDSHREVWCGIEATKKGKIGVGRLPFSGRSPSD